MFLVVFLLWQFSDEHTHLSFLGLFYVTVVVAMPCLPCPLTGIPAFGVHPSDAQESNWTQMMTNVAFVVVGRIPSLSTWTLS